MSIPYPAPAQSGFSFSQTVSRQTAHGQTCKHAGKPYDPTSLRSSEAPWQTTAISSVAADLLCQWGDALSTGEPAHDEYSIFYGSSDLYLLGDGSRQRN
jgi:mannan endo-1,4-beta-mannosidase